MKVTICIGSACHLKGSREIISKLQKLVDENGLSDKVDLNGAFCSGNCDHGVCVTVEGELYSLKPEDTEEFLKMRLRGDFDYGHGNHRFQSHKVQTLL